MERQDVFLFIIIITIVILYLSKMYETYVSGSFDITPAITVGMDWKGSQAAGIPFYPNNLVNPPQNVDVQMKKLQSYEPEIDGQTTSNYVSTNMQNNKKMINSNVPNDLEGFTMMNPYIRE
jgi:hypothetical protein